MWVFTMMYLVNGVMMLSMMGLPDAGGCYAMMANATKYVERSGGEVKAATCGKSKEV